MKLAYYPNLKRQDNLFYGSEVEPETRYKRRQVKIVPENYDFALYDAIELTSISHWIANKNKCSTEQHCIEHMQESITDWATHDAAEKELFLEYVLHVVNPTLTSSQMEDIESRIYIGYTVNELGSVSPLKTWDGSAWI